MNVRTRIASLLAAGAMIMAVGAVSAAPPTYTINLTKSANPANVPPSGGTVVYTVAVVATGTGSFGTVTVNDGMAACTLGARTGDTDSDGNLDPGETWSYSCTVNNVTPGTQNTASVIACHNSSGSCNQANQDASDTDMITVGEGPAVTQPPATQPPATDPPVTDPPVTDPPVTDPPVTDPPVTDPPVTDPPVTDPPVTDPPATQAPASAAATPTFDAGVEDDGDTPDETEPSTDAIGGDGEARPSDRSWMLVIALGMVLASIVIITPSTAIRQHRN